MTSPEMNQPGAATPGPSAEPTTPTSPPAATQDKPAVQWVPVASLTVRAPFRNLWEPEDAGSAKVSAIIEDMRARGFDPAFPIVVWRHRYGHEYETTVIDGHTRLAAAKQIGRDQVPVVFREFYSHGQAINYAVHCQRDRRSLTPAAILRCVKAMDKPKRGRPSKNAAAAGISQPQTTAQTAAALGVSEDTVQRARVITEHGSQEIQQAVKQGELSIAAAHKAVQEERRAATATEPAAAPPPPSPATPPPVVADDDDVVDPDDPVGYGAEAGELPCPFCGRRWVKTREYGGRRDPAHAHVECEICGAQGPILHEWREERPLPEFSQQWRRATLAELKREAVELWNKALRATVVRIEPGDFQAQLIEVARAKPRDQWTAIANAMETVARQLREEGSANA